MDFIKMTPYMRQKWVQMVENLRSVRNDFEEVSQFNGSYNV